MGVSGRVRTLPIFTPLALLRALTREPLVLESRPVVSCVEVILLLEHMSHVSSISPVIVLPCISLSLVYVDSTLQ